MYTEASVVDEFANCCSADQVFAVVVPNARDIVLAEFVRGYVKVSASCLLVNVVKSDVDNSPLFNAEAVGMLNVNVDPAPVIVKSVPVVDVASVTAGPVVVWFVGPIEVSADVRRPREDVAVSVYPLDELPTSTCPYVGEDVSPVPP